MSLFALAAAAAFMSAPNDLPPVPNVNVALVFDGMEVAADTTDGDGRAGLPVSDGGEYGVKLQESVPVDSVLFVLIGGEEIYVELTPDYMPNPAIQFPADTGSTAQILLLSLDREWTPSEPPPAEIPDQTIPPIEQTHADPEGHIDPPDMAPAETQVP